MSVRKYIQVVIELLFSKKVLTPQPAHGKGQPGSVLILTGEATCMLKTLIKRRLQLVTSMLYFILSL